VLAGAAVFAVAWAAYQPTHVLRLRVDPAGQSNALLEAMAVGTPVVARACAGNVCLLAPSADDTTLPAARPPLLSDGAGAGCAGGGVDTAGVAAGADVRSLPGLAGWLVDTPEQLVAACQGIVRSRWRDEAGCGSEGVASTDALAASVRERVAAGDRLVATRFSERAEREAWVALMSEV
jgi:glycosyltransferase involved in cell wall biosynthesis